MGLRFCIADKFPAKIDAADLRPHGVAKILEQSPFCLLFRAAPEAYGRSQARGQVRAVADGLQPRPQPQPQQFGIRATSAAYTAAQGIMGSLTH